MISISVLSVIFLSITSPVYAMDTKSEENICRDIGFTPKTIPYADCVMELVARSQKVTLQSKLANQSPDAPKTKSSGVSKKAQNNPSATVKPVVVVQGDGTPDDATCQRYGYKPNQSDYAGCRLQLDQARQTAAREQERYNVELARYQQQVAELERQQRQDKAMRQFEGAMRLLAGQGSGGSGSPNYQAPPPPQAPTTYQTIRLPNGSQVYCTVTGSYTSCN